MAWTLWAAAAVCLVVPGLASAKDLDGGTASYFSSEMAGNRTASGERCDPSALTAAHRTAPMGSRLRVTSVTTGRSVVVRVNDRGPFRGGRVIDLSRAAADAIGLTRMGRGEVRLAIVEDGDRVEYAAN
jgi:rare lipoprotein A